MLAFVFLMHVAEKIREMGVCLSNQRILPISKSPFIRAYPEFAFVDMIANNEMRAGEIMFRGSVSEVFDERWRVDGGRAKVFLNGSEIEIEESFYEPKYIKRVSRKLREKDSLIFRIDYQQNTNLWDSAGIFVDEEKISYDDFTTHIAALTNFCANLLIARVNDEAKYFGKSVKEDDCPIWLKLVVENGGISFSYAEKEGEWKEMCFCEGTFDFENHQYVAGIYFSMAERQYYKWLFNNFINYRLNIEDDAKLKYIGMARDCRHYAINPLLRFSDDYYSVLKEYGVGLWEYIIANINHNRYIEFWLNERFIPGLEAYRKRNHYHEGLIYGYDTNREILYAVFFFQGKPKCIEVKKDDLYQAYMHSSEGRANRIFLLEFNPSDKYYGIDLEGIVRQLEEYVMGTNPTQRYAGFIGTDPGVFGISCYQAFLTDDTIFNLIFSDVRISYIFQEHKKCMVERVKYLISMGFFPKEEGEVIVKKLLAIWEKAKLLMNLVIKARVKESYRKEEVVRAQIQMIEEQEKEVYPKIIELLKNYI